MDLKIFALNASKEWGIKIAKHLSIPAPGKHEERDFEDGEHKIRPLETVRGKDIFVVHSLYSDEDQTVNDKICRLLFFIGALKDASAGRITVIIPYFAYARKDRKTKSRDPLTLRYMAQLFEAMGVDIVLSMDIHNLAAYQNAFRINTEHLEAALIFAPYLCNKIKNDNIVVVSPDTGGLKRAEKLQELISARLQREISKAFLIKKRSADVVSGGEAVIGDVRKKTAIIIDDIISSGSTIQLAAQALSQAGAHKIIVCASHGIFVKNANRILADPLVNEVIITNSIPPFRLKQKLIEDKVTMLDASYLFAQAIRKIHGDMQ